MLTGIGAQHKGLTIINFLDNHQPVSHLLSADEEQRAARFRFAPMQERFRLGRGTLRRLLGQACHADPQTIEFQYSATGKPSLKHFPDMHFNVSHSGDLWACILSPGQPVGLDIERAKPIPDRQALAARFFSAPESDEISACPEPLQQAAFYRCWTRKEAYLKAVGAGLSKGLSTFRVSTGEEEWSAVEDPSATSDWRVQSFTPAPGYFGAIATLRGETK